MSRSPEPAPVPAGVGATPGAQSGALSSIKDLDIIGELGRGAQAVVYRVRHQGAEFALKLLHDSADGNQAAAAFRRQAGLVACVAHPGVTQVYEVGDVNERPYLVMDLADGWALNRLLEAGPMTPDRAVSLGVEIAGALAAAHRVGVVHRDVKPQNIVVSGDGQARLIDFGLAIQPAGQVALDAVAGTVAYAAPEQTGMLKRPVDGRADLYALGVVLFECLTGQRPFDAADPGELIRLHIAAPAPEIRKLRPEVPQTLADLVAKLLAKDPDDRYQTGDGLLADLRRISRDPDEDFVLAGHDRLAGAARRPLIGRRGELGRLAELWGRVTAGRGAVAVVEGTLGIGKTRLVEEFLDSVSAAGTPVLQAACMPGDPVPMAALRAAVEEALWGGARLAPARRSAAIDQLRTAAGPAAALLGPLSPTLATMLHLGKPEPAGEDDRLTTAAATFLAGLARTAGGLVVHLDNAGNLDAASQRVLRQLAGDLADVPLLLVCTGSTDPGSGPDAAETGWAAARDLTVDLRVTVGPLTDEEIGRLAQVQLGADVIAEPLKAQLVTRARGNPGMLLEYLRAMLEDGAIRPSWGTWLLDEAALARLDLSADVADLMIRRLDGLSEPAREIMTAAAAIPLPFSLNLLAAICEVDFESAADALQQAISQGTVANRPGGSYVFLHDLLTRALLSGLTGEERRQLHLRVAHALGMTGLTGSAISYALAHEYELGDPGYTTPGMFTACYRAGRLALAEDAAPEAAHFLELARHTADRTGVPLDSAFEHICGLVAMRQGRYDEARGYFGAAIDGEPDPVRRAEILSLVAQTYRGEYRAAECVSTVQLALAELGEALPASRRELLRSTLRLFRAGLKVGRSKPGQLFGTAEGEEQRRFRIQVHLQRLGAAGANMGLDGPLAVAFLLRSLYPANRVGTSPETIRLRADLGVLANAVGWRWRARRLLRSARVLADMSGDPGLAAHVARARAMSEDQGRGLRARSGSATISMLQSYGRWLDPDEYLASVATLGSMQVLRGYAREALVWCDRGAARVAAGARVLGTPYAMVRVLAGSALGRVSEASAQLGAMREYVETTGTPEQQLHMLVASEHAALEQGELGATFDDAVAERASLPLPLRPGRFWAPYSVLWVYQVFGRLAQAREATGDARAERLEQARAALRLLGRASGAPVLRAYHLCAQASYQQLTGKPGRALRRLVRAERLAHGLDLPSLTAEIATVRARALAALGEGAESRRQAKNAYLLATDYGWQPRGRALRLEFEVSMLASAMDQSHTSLMSSSVGGPYQRRLIALQEVSMAAATVLDPRELARVALDEIIRILGAERALLFLTDDDTDELHPHLGRDAAGHDLDELTGYGSTLVERVHQTREPLVITGSEQGAALGSESVVVHGLRSIMVAPLQLKGRLLGVVYLDNRVAKGVFTVGDVDILSAITHLIAASLETARAAQLELAVHTAQQQRDLADTMRAAIADVGATLDPTEVITRLAGTLKRVLDSDLAFLLRPGTDGWTGAPIEEPVEEEAVGCQVGPVDKPDPVDVSNPAVAALVATSTGTVHELPRPLAGAMSGVRGWLAIPLAARDERVGVLVIASCTGGSYDEAQAKIAAALAGQAMIAYDNALLFSRVEQLATIDSLSGLNNRRHFFELATRDVEVAVRQRRPLATAMLDIDHFKKINDTYGHAVGDEVIREVASRISHNLRSFDIVGRYGGEEFALVLPEVGDEITTIAERLRAAVAGTPVQTAGGPVPVTVSIGVARSQGSDDLDCMLVRADEALYKAKAGGRNRVQHA